MINPGLPEESEENATPPRPHSLFFSVTKGKTMLLSTKTMGCISRMKCSE